MTNDARLGALLLFLSACAATSIVYANAQSYSASHALQTGYTDSRDYLAMAQGERVEGKRGHRILVPWLARHVPSLPGVLFSPHGQAIPERDLARRFAVVNAIFLIGACASLLGISRSVGLDWRQTAAVLAMFLSAPSVVIAGGLPMTDTALWCFLAAALLAILRQQPLAYLFVLGIGVMAKELVLLAVPMVLILRMPWRARAAFLAASVPAIVIAFALRPTIGPFALPQAGAGGVLHNVSGQLQHLATVHGAVDVGLAFGLAWIPALTVWRRPVPAVLRRLALLLPIVVFGEVAFGSMNVPRNFFAAFPAVLPLASLGLSRWIDADMSDDRKADGRDIQR